MAILAQAILDISKFPDTIENRYTDIAKHYIDPKTPLERQAVRIVYQDDLYGALSEMVRADQLDFPMICRNTRMPTDKIWLEWHDSQTEDGALIDFGVLMIPNRTEGSDKSLLAFVFNRSKNTNDLPRLSMVFATDPPPYANNIPNTTHLLWCLDDRNGQELKTDLWKLMCALAIRTMIFSLFLLNQPKLIDRTEIVYGDKQNKKRAKHGKPPLIDHTITKLKFHILGSNIERRAREGQRVAGLQGQAPEGDKRGMRYHYVIGHFRCYHRGQENEHLIWIEPYYKGDASKGVVIRERVLSKA